MMSRLTIAGIRLGNGGVSRQDAAGRGYPVETPRQKDSLTRQLLAAGLARRVGSAARLRRAGYAAPFTSLEDGVADYVRNYLATNDWYR